MKALKRIVVAPLVVAGTFFLASAWQGVPQLSPPIPVGVSDAVRSVMEVAIGGTYVNDDQVKFLILWLLLLSVAAVFAFDTSRILKQNRHSSAWTSDDTGDFVVVFESFCKASVAAIKSAFEENQIRFYVSHGVLDMADCVADTDAENMVLVPTRIYVSPRQKRRALQVISELQLTDWS